MSKISHFGKLNGKELLRLFGLSKLDQLKKRHAIARRQVDWWIDEIRKAEWKNPQMIKEKYRSADFLHGNRVIFNIKGNQYRIVVEVDYEGKAVEIKWAGTHAEYSKMRF